MRVINHLEAGGRDAAKGHFARGGKGGAGDFYRCSDRTAGWTEGLNERLDRENLSAGGGAADRRDGDLLARLGARGHGGRDFSVGDDLEGGCFAANDYLRSLREADSGDGHGAVHLAGSGFEAGELGCDPENLAAVVARRERGYGYGASECTGRYHGSDVSVGDVVKGCGNAVKRNASCAG